MRIDIWSDVVCPWCYIGKRRMESALAGFEHADQVEVVWHSFQLDPSAPEDGGPVADMLAAKYGMSRDEALATNQRISALAAEEGLEYHLENTRHTNTLDAHRLIHLAATHGLQGAAKERMLHAYFVEGANVGDLEVLVSIGVELGLDEAEVRAALSSDAFAAEVGADIAQARAYGISGVPFFVLDGRYGVSGAQPVEVLDSALRQAWAEHTPALLQPVGGSGEACDDGSCAV